MPVSVTERFVVVVVFQIPVVLTHVFQLLIYLSPSCNPPARSSIVGNSAMHLICR